MINYYFYDGQLRSYLLQIVSIFYGLQVKTGKLNCDEEQFISVPCVVGSKDRVVAALFAGNTQNRPVSIPCMSLYMTALSPAPERRKVQAFVDQRVTMPTGGIFPDDLTVLKRAQPIPYNMTVELSIIASNTMQLHQILEQILVLFNPDIQFQKTDSPFDWTRITRMELTDVGNEETVPAGTTQRMISWTLGFTVPIYLSIPAGVRDDVVRKIFVQFGNLNQLTVNEVDESGEIVPFSTPYDIIKVDTTTQPIVTELTATFKSTSPPINPTVGDSWWRPALGKALIWNGTRWSE